MMKAQAKKKRPKIEKRVRVDIRDRSMMEMWAEFEEAAIKQGWTTKELKQIEESLEGCNREDFICKLLSHVVTTSRRDPRHITIIG